MSVCCECCVLSGRGLCDALITRPEESYRLWCVVVYDLETSRMKRPWPALGRSTTKKKFKNIDHRFHYCPSICLLFLYMAYYVRYCVCTMKLKYKSLCIEMQRMWNLKCTIVPVIIGATGIVKKSLSKNLEAVPGKHSIDALQKTAILGTSHTIRKVLQCEA